MIYALGESLLDIIIAGNGKTTAKPGGAMLNAAVSLARSGREVYLITETGDDLTAKYIIDFLKNNGVYTSYISKYGNTKTSLAVAYLDKNKKAVYSFYKQYPGKRLLKFPKSFSPADILLFGSLYAADNEVSDNITNMLERFNGLVVYDPNIRQKDSLNDKTVKDSVVKYLSTADVVKGSDEDFENIFETGNVENQLALLRELNPNALLIITRGEKGAVALRGNLRAGVQAYEINPVSTVGAGDAFSAGIIDYLCRNKTDRTFLKKMDGNKLKELLKSGIDFATKVCLSDENYI